MVQLGVQTQWIPLVSSVVFSFIGYFSLVLLIPRSKGAFIKAGLRGKDMAKKDNPIIPEALGILVAGVYLVLLFLFIPLPFINDIAFETEEPEVFKRFISQIAGILSICCTIFLGMSDDIFDLRWRDKVFLPTVASLPLLMVYYVTYHLTVIVVPIPLRPYFGTTVDIGILYYLYMGSLAVFCSNSINILAGINGLEVGQSVVIATSLIIFNCLELYFQCCQMEAHLLSLYLLIPFLGCSLALLRYNWYPAEVFVGDTYCYFAGMLFAVVGILGHFSKTLLLMFIPQIVNFVYSVPQLFRMVPCPRHRLPRYDPDIDKSHASETQFKSKDLKAISSLVIFILKTCRLLKVKESTVDGEKWMTCNNMTLNNLVLIHSGPMREDKLCIVILVLQVTCSCVAFVIRYPLAYLFYS
ncbi:UDP-N-acetylglucosamine--dolichyl-phosphate N-acetylglucosaminephosphotransferase-like [Symsagittifera roscoffensis]|uniref:UDP-N-acetylglucosamine--dolichyl-phosphate N-acetylglucosaminephosphotransferase-like n=1 Tax=Symsagittifera roscoffensis TaxID=84072 RepID=UPI00307B2870